MAFDRSSEVSRPSAPGAVAGSVAQPLQRGRRSRAFVDLGTGSIPRHIFGLAWPQVIEQTLNILDQTIDMFWAGRLPGGFRALAGLGVAQTFSQFGFMSRQGLEQSTRAMVARAVGAKDLALANNVALQSFILTGGYSLIIVLVGIFLTDAFFRMIGASAAVHAQAAMYMRIQFIGMGSMSFRMAASSILQASGDVMLPLRATAVTRAIHVALSPVLIFGWLGFPRFELAGAALANLFAQSVGAGINLYALFLGGSRLRLTLRGLRVDRHIMWQMVRIGAPASVSGMERAVSQLFLLKIVSPFGDIAMAAYGMTRRLEMFANFGAQGVGNATGIMVGQNLGARKPERAKRSVLWGIGFDFCVKCIIGSFLIFFPTFVVGIFTHEPEVVAITTVWLRILALASFFMGVGVVFSQSFNVAGDTVSVMLVTLVTVALVEIPTAWLLSHPLGIGALGVAWANVAGMASRAAIFVPLYLKGNWLKRQVI